MGGEFGRVHIVHDWLDSYGGAERMIETIVDIVQPQKFSTLLANPQSKLAQKLAPILEVSLLQKLPFAFHWHRYLLGWYPQIIELFDVSGSDLVLSSSHCVAKGALSRSNQLHVCYTYTPARYLWDMASDYLRENKITGLKRWYVERVFHRLRNWDFISSSRVDLYIAISKYVARRIWKFYRRPALVIYPYVDIEKFHFQEGLKRQNYFVLISRLVSQKRVDVAVEACAKGGINLKVIGTGPELARLRSLANSYVEFFGNLSEAEISPIVQGAQGLIFTPEEDFGIVPLEAQALGTPVLALGRGGALETVIDGKTGGFYHESSADSLLKALRAWRPETFKESDLIQNAQNFSKQKFISEVRGVLRDSLAYFRTHGLFDDKDFIGKLGCSGGDYPHAIV